MRFRFLLLIPVLTLLAAISFAQATASSSPSQSKPNASTRVGLPDALPASEFARLIREFSEEDGHFFSDNLLSNETCYLHIVDKLKQIGGKGGAYIGVGPEQNFTYIAKVRPRIAFIIDIRHMAAIQHLMYKAIFHRSRDRAEFLSRLLSRPLNAAKAPGAGASLDQLLEYFANARRTKLYMLPILLSFGRRLRATLATRFQLQK